MRLFRAASLLLLVLVPTFQPAAQTVGLGSVSFPNSGARRAQPAFLRGLALLHSFEYDDAAEAFREAQRLDPGFALAYWGEALTYDHPIWGEHDSTAARAALARLGDSPEQRIARGKTPREQAYLSAVEALYGEGALAARYRAYEAAMGRVQERFPDDLDAAALHALSLLTIRPRGTTDLRTTVQAAAICEAVLHRNPTHPGATHYLIHAYDDPVLAPLGLPVARRYARIAPRAEHALHMPSHIFVRLGQWREAVASCQAAWDASVAWVRREKLSADHQDFHSLSWLIELSFERGRRGDADRALAIYAEAVRGGLTRDKRGAFANQVASYLARTGEWTRVDELLAPLQAPAADAGSASAGSSMACGHGPEPAGSPGERLERRAVLGAQAEAAAGRRDEPGVRRFLDQRDAVDAELHPFLVATQPKELVERTDKLRGLVREALLARARGDDRAMIAALRPLATDQDREFIGEGTAGGMLHHEAIAEALARLGDARQALSEYRVVLANHAGRARSLLGAARAAAKTGDDVASRDYYRKLLAAWSEASEDTDGLAEARRAVAAP